ncbi:MAG: hypothetical protein ACPG55_08715, partial [Luminiphilus sp.]
VKTREMLQLPAIGRYKGCLPDVASASEGMKHNERHEFAMRVLENTFDKNMWSIACRVVPLINYLWALATEDHDTALSLRAVIEEHYPI